MAATDSASLRALCPSALKPYSKNPQEVTQSPLSAAESTQPLLCMWCLASAER
jgi:hypothetical protein